MAKCWSPRVALLEDGQTMLELGEAPQKTVAGDLAPERLAAANIHPVSRLATDYLNHFNNVVMLLDLIPSMPDCIEEVLDWRPMDYCSYFAASRFRERDLAIRAYNAADPVTRQAFEGVIAELDDAVISAQAALQGPGAVSPETRSQLRDLVRGRLQPLISEAGGLINGQPLPDVLPSEDTSGSTQDSIDELFV